MDDIKVKKYSRVLSVAFYAVIFIYVLYKNFPIFGDYVVLSEGQISDLSPSDRLIKYPEPVAQVSDFVYFKTKSKGYDRAKISITFKSENPDQEIHLGFKDRGIWHYSTKPAYLPLLEYHDWKKTGVETKLLQKTVTYDSVESLLRNPPKDDVVGEYHLKRDNSINVLAAYTPKKEMTVVNQPLRGSHTFYTYLNDEPFALTVEKQDLNWYEGEDSLEISVYKGDILVSQKIIRDDGVHDTSGAVMPTQKENVNYSGGNPENGVYKVVLNTNADTVIKSITSSFSKIVFEGGVYPIGGSGIYDPQISGQVPPTVYSDSIKINFTTQHNPSFQDVFINDVSFSVNQINIPMTFVSNNNQNTITVPNGDVKIESMGFFAFHEDQYFTPFIYKKFQIKNIEDLNNVNYVLTDYAQPYNLEDGWKTAELEYDLDSAYYSKGELSWMIRSPDLKKNGGKVFIKDLKVELRKDPIVDF
jgi:hypothetical protein